MENLCREAINAQKFSYSPYSNFQVGAALLCKSGRIYTGCNVENVAFAPSNCGERTAFFKAVSEGERDFSAIAVVGNPKDVSPLDHGFCTPCGVCLQVMAEFCDPDTFQVVFVKTEDVYEIHLLKELLPFAFHC